MAVRRKPRKLTVERPWPSLGPQVIAWIEFMLCHGIGDVQGQALELPEPWADLVIDTYRVHPTTGRRKYNEVAAIYPKGTSKTELAGALCCVEALGPVRFDHFAVAGETTEWGYEYDEGEPVGRPVVGAEVLILATAEDQTGFTYDDNVYFMLKNGVVADWYPGLDVGLTRTNLPGGGTIEVVTSKARSKDGGKSTFVVVDEGHLWTDSPLWRLFSTIRRNIVKRAGGAEPWLFHSSTAWLPGEESVVEATSRMAEQIAAGQVKDPRLLWVHRKAEVPERWDDDRAMTRALKVAYKGFPWLDIRALLAEIRDPRTRREDAARYFLGVPEASGASWISTELLTARRSDSPELQPGEAIVAGFDGSKSEDATALVAVRLSDGVAFELGLWEKPAGQGDHRWEVPADEVDDRVRWAIDTYDVRLFYADPPWWRDLIFAWQAEWPDIVLAYETNQPKRMDEAVELAESGLRSSKATIHRNSDGLARHIGNAGSSMSRGFRRIGKRKQALKIDAAVAWVLAWRAYHQVTADGGEKEAVSPWFAYD